MLMCTGMTGVTGKALREAQYINKRYSHILSVDHFLWEGGGGGGGGGGYSEP